MQIPFNFGPLKFQIPGHPASIIQPLLHASERGDDLGPVAQAITHSFGFEVFSHSVVLSLRLEAESHVYLFCTHQPVWVQIYDQRAYIEVDPRVPSVLETSLPVIWDQGTFRGKSAATDQFLDAAMSYGIASGVAIAVRDNRGHGGSMTALSSASPAYDAARLALVNRRLGEIILFAQCLHEICRAAILQRGIAPPSRGAPLSGRERECLTLASRGLTSEDIAGRLEISPRTVEFHFAGIRSKLAALNRQEAIAKAMAAGIIHT
jgi:LuxR family transcriptional regulator, activator of conjugal transfer of Ti plasmids